MFCSTIIPTVGRSSLADAVHSVLSQEGAADDCEVIVVNDSGRPLPAAGWQQMANVRVLDTQRRERCVARNTGAAMAHGKYLHFLDDDDLLLPGALAAFRKLDQREPDAVWLYGSYQTVDNSGAVVDVWRPAITGDIFALLVTGEGIPFQTSLVRSRDFHAVGMFDPDPAVVGVEDRDVGRRLAFAGRVAYTPEVVAQIRIGQVGSTTNWATLAAADRWSREKALRMQDVTGRLRRSTAGTPQLQGRVCRAYMASCAWNLHRRNGFTALSRLSSGLVLAGRGAWFPAFWRGLRVKPGGTPPVLPTPPATSEASSNMTSDSGTVPGVTRA
ncbi:MAG: glycosyltransferase [Caldilineaceae bacterium]|nr:glycosyltransferase [Caldilineaceae bacterium]